MGSILKYQELRETSTDDLIDLYDKHTNSTVVNTSYYLQEIYRREDLKRMDEMLGLTRQMRFFTVAVTLLTLVNVAVVILASI